MILWLLSPHSLHVITIRYPSHIIQYLMNTFWNKNILQTVTNAKRLRLDTFHKRNTRATSQAGLDQMEAETIVKNSWQV